MANRFSELAFTQSVKAAQAHYGSRSHYAKFEDDGRVQNDRFSDAESDFIEQRDGFYMATVGETGHPYIQFRGGPPGFLKMIDERTFGIADFRGNLQYISVGNLSKNNKAALFLMDYANQRRLKIFADVEIKDASEVPEMVELLRMPGYKAKVERVFIFHLEAFDWNCPQHITPRFTLAEIQGFTQPLNEHIERLEREIEKLRKGTK